MKYLTANFSITGADEMLLQASREVLADELAAVGFESFEDTDGGLTGYVQSELLDREGLAAVCREFPLEGVSVSYELAEVEDRDWNETWENEGFDPIDIKGQVIIYDARHPFTLPQTDGTQSPVTIAIEARQAFGTGTHQTTRMVVQTLLNIELADKRVLDCGCGTGILSLVASKLGAGSVVGYDIDEWSVENTKHNAQLNAVDNLEVFTGDASVLSHISGVFDVVMANINRNILLADMAAFKDVMRPNAILILSGFYVDDAQILVEKARELGLTEINRRTEDDWCCLVLK